MRQLTNNEKRLLMGAGLILFVFANIFALELIFRKQKTWKAQLSNLKTEQLVAKSLLQQKQLWLERKKYLDTTQPKLMNSPEEAAGEFQAALQASAKEYKITISESQLSTDSVKQPYYQEVAFTLKAVGRLEDMVRWIVSLQQPDLFQAITKFSLKVDADPTKVKCDELRIARLYAPIK